ncbi:MAG TPA: hypothetical protein DD435_16000, partial [Cyanobacteria bacterium UBA8530]|nr:hypothetical protein [Cyanobacteria bacterium UBA8530]
LAKKRAEIERTDGASNPETFSEVKPEEFDTLTLASVTGEPADESGLKEIFSRLLGRAPTERELARYSGVDLPRVERSIKDTLEYRVGTYGEAVRKIFNEALGRLPTDKEMDKYSSLMAAGSSEADLRSRIFPLVFVRSGKDRIQIQESSASVGRAPGAADAKGDITALSEINEREFNKGAVVSVTGEGAKISQFAQNGLLTVRTPQDALICQDPGERKTTVFTPEGWVIEVSPDNYQGVDRNGEPASKSHLKLKVTDPQGYVRLDLTKPNPAAEDNSVVIGGVSLDFSVDRQAGVITELVLNLPELKLSIDENAGSSIRLSRREDGSSTTIKYSSDKFEFSLQGAGRAFYDETATAPVLPEIPRVVPITPAEESKPLFLLAGGAVNSVYSSVKPPLSLATRLKELLGKGTFMTGLKGLVSSIGKASLIGGAIEGVASLMENIFKVYQGKQDTAKALRNVAADTTSGAIGGGLSALGSGLAMTALGFLGLAGAPLTIAAAFVGMITYWLSRGPIRRGVGNLFGTGEKN